MLSILKSIAMLISFVGLIFMIVLLIFDGDISKIKNIGKKGTKKEKSSESKKNKTEKKKVNKINIKNTQDILDFNCIRILSKYDPKGLIVKDDYRTFIGVIEVKGTNYNLLSEEEKIILEESFAQLLTGIDYPIQIMVQSRKLDIDNYIKIYQDRLNEIITNRNKLQEKLEFIKDNKNIINDEIEELNIKINKLNNQIAYGENLINFIKRTCSLKEMLEKRYYIILKHTHNSLAFKEKLTEKEKLENAFNDIQNKADALITALQKAGLEGKLLTGIELAELLYVSYNKGDSEYYKLRKAIESGFSHLYTTATPVEIKAMELKLKKLEENEDEILKL